jgi:hypothetical protein
MRCLKLPADAHSTVARLSNTAYMAFRRFALRQGVYNAAPPGSLRMASLTRDLTCSGTSHMQRGQCTSGREVEEHVGQVAIVRLLTFAELVAERSESTTCRLIATGLTDFFRLVFFTTVGLSPKSRH